MALPNTSLVNHVSGVHYVYLFVTLFSEVGSFVHPCEEDLVCKGSIEKVPYFNAPIYLENKSQIGKVDEIFGPMHSYVKTLCFECVCVVVFLAFPQYFSVKLLPDMNASSFKSEQKVLIPISMAQTIV